ncbi:5-oxoprolinase subunit B family protein [Nonomuraea soli]|uniref:KipI family sensor histidine kinase inhibitor n=1 Tax=Nonomuraea soli TaxID=1032476 RepID=A0A7W0CT56_9ACTN|nr:allophanate hydrolase subunit 1 [Nonomuraea soli]MBA2896733.1 KipI family sensor histidine kinase inhibitor [Nonomuraea soli]
MTVPAGAIRFAGEHGLLVETGSLAQSHRIDALLRSERPPGVVEIVPGPETVLVVAPGADMPRLRGHLGALLAATTAPITGEHDVSPPAEPIVIPVIYDGEDLESVAEAAGLTPDEVVTRHTSSDLVVGWLGFAPGFAYLTGLDPALHLPRLTTPRTSVPAGSVAVAGPYSAVYPSASPGGWRLLGRTGERIWDVRADPPSRFRPGMRVRFERA